MYSNTTDVQQKALLLQDDNMGIWKSGNGSEVETEMTTKNAQIVGAVCIQTHELCLCRYFCILLSNGYRTGFISHVLCLHSCAVLCNYVFTVID